MSDRRAISTVVDVTLALLLVSASIVTMATFLETGNQGTTTPSTAEETAEMLSGTTMTVNYSIRDVSRQSHFDDGSGSVFDDGSEFNYTRSVHGPAAGMVSEVALANVSIAGTSLVLPAEDYSTAVDGELRDRLTEAGVDAQVVAIWEPFNRSEIRGRATMGVTPPVDADVSTFTLTVPSDVPTVDESRLESEFRRNGTAGAAQVIADAIVAGYFPPEESQLALEEKGLERRIVYSRYKRLGNALGVDYDAGITSPLPGNSPISRTGADAWVANRKLADALADRIESDLDAKFSDPSAKTLSEAVSTGSVTIVVKVWTE